MLKMEIRPNEELIKNFPLLLWKESDLLSKLTSMEQSFEFSFFDENKFSSKFVYKGRLRHKESYGI
jgi:hypothetical protein